jgi:hypothetical protein
MRYHHRTPRTPIVTCAALCAAALFGIACGEQASNGDSATAAADRRDSAGATAPAPVLVARVQGFLAPESVRYDSTLDVYFVSNVNGDELKKDGNGFIAKVDPETRTVTRFVEGGKNGVSLNGPKGMAVISGTLWVADIDVVRGFDLHTGAHVRDFDLSKMGALFLNDVCAGPDGDLYITDTGLRADTGGTMAHPGPDRIFHIGADNKISVALEGKMLAAPNGITFDAAQHQFVLAPYGSPAISTWRAGAATTDSIAAGPGQFDGVEILSDGRMLVSSWADSSVHVVRNGIMTTLIHPVVSPADIGVDTKRHRVLIPSMTTNTVEIWQLAGT